jgi:hypothetical protein
MNEIVVHCAVTFRNWRSLPICLSVRILSGSAMGIHFVKANMCEIMRMLVPISHAYMVTPRTTLH